MPRPRLFQDARLLTSVRASDDMIVRNRFESRVTCYNELKMNGSCLEHLKRSRDRFKGQIRTVYPRSEFPFARFFNGPFLSLQGVSNTGPLAEHFIRGTSSLFTRILHPASNKGIGRSEGWLSGRRKTCIKRVARLSIP